MSKTIYGDYAIDIKNIINFNYVALRIPTIMTYTAIFSAKYSDLIWDKLNNIIILPYDNVESADFYIEYLIPNDSYQLCLKDSFEDSSNIICN